MAGTAANSECRDVSMECALGERDVNVKCYISVAGVQTLSVLLSPEWILCGPAAVCWSP